MATSLAIPVLQDYQSEAACSVFVLLCLWHAVMMVKVSELGVRRETCLQKLATQILA